MPRQLELYFDNLEDLQEKDQIYMEDKFRLIMGKLGEIDGLLNEKSSGWKTTRMSKSRSDNSQACRVRDQV